MNNPSNLLSGRRGFYGVKKERLSEIMVLALPIIGGMMSQTLLNIIDIKMVSHLGPTAIAAVGFCSFINFVAASVFIGLSVGVQAIVARRMGENQLKKAARPLNAGIAINLAFAIPVSVALIVLAPQLLNFMLDDEALIAEGLPYLQARFAGIAALGINFCFRGFFSAIRQTRVYLRTIITIHIINVAVSYLLVFGVGPFPEMGALGAGLGTSISLMCGSLIYMIYAYIKCRHFGFGWTMPKRHVVSQVLKISIPASLQQLFFAGGFTVFFWIISQVGTDEVALSNIYVNLLMVAALPCIGFGLAASTLVSQALGRKEPEDAHAWAWDVAKVASVAVCLIGVPLAIFPEFFLGFFFDDEELIQNGAPILRLVGLMMPLDAMGIVFLNALQGAGATSQTMRVTVVAQWLVCLPLTFCVGPLLGLGLSAIWIVQVAYRSVQAMIFMGMWQKRRWQSIQL
ncbi:MAG: MATE family efflux transporter [Pseudomonadota bacterium]